MLSFIYAAYPEAERATLWLLYVALQRPRFTLPCVTTAERELLPHIFTISFSSLLKGSRGCYFLWHFLFFRLPAEKPRLTRGGLPYAVRTFLPITLKTER